jgi:hypothetical protein
MASKSNKKFAHTTSQQAYYMRPSEAKVVSLEGTARVDDAQKVRLGVVLMTKRPADLEQWLAYHRRVVGVEKFFLQIEDTPELAALLLRPPWNGCVDATFVAKTHRDYFVQMDRQAVNVKCAVERARAHGLEWLLHVDDDEMLHCPAGAGALHAALRALPPQCCDAHIKNLEALAPAPTCSRPFSECVTFVASTSKFASYTNGKSFGRVSSPGLRAHGPHHFRGDGSNATRDLPPSVAVVLHYESVAYERWTTKFSELAQRHGHDAKILEKLPFPFYRASLAAVGRLAAAADKDKAKAADDAFRVWSKSKVAGVSTLAPRDTVEVTAVRDALARLALTDASEADRAPLTAPPAKRPVREAKPPEPLPKI